MFMIMIIAVLAAASVYITFFIKRALGFWFKKLKKSAQYIIAAAVAAVVTSLGAVFMPSPILIILLYLVMAGIFCDILRLILNHALKKRETAAARADSALRCGLIPLIASLLAVTFGFFNMNTVHRTEYIVATDKNVGSGYRLAFISDLHFGVSMDLADLKKYCDEISAEEPDIVLLGGDIVDERTEKQNVQPAFETLGGIKSKFGVYFVYGNHDRTHYSDSPNYTNAQLEEIIENSGITVLDGETRRIAENFVIVGRENIGISHSKPFSQGNDRTPTARLLDCADEDDFILLLDHQPVGFEENAAAGVDLQLSGHTHSGQIWPIGLLIGPISSNELEYGIERKGDFTAIVSSGIAGWGYNIRTEGISEYLLVTISR